VKILILASSFSGLCQRVLRELLIAGHHVDQHYGMDPPLLREQISRFQPDLIVCPFLTHRIPDDIWQNHRCLIVHPGIEGDRGPSSLDWAISGDRSYWGVTLLQADAEMDAGDIWGTAEFPLRDAGKTSIYKREVSEAAVRLIKQAITNAATPGFKPRPLDYKNPAVKGVLLDTMRQQNRKIDWQNDSTRTVLQKIRAADTSPGVLDQLLGHEVFLYGPIQEPHLRGEPGELLALAYGAACIATIDGAVWIRQMKCRQHAHLPAIKLPAKGDRSDRTGRTQPPPARRTERNPE
jgi:putative two-component system hydrogenase maturation factor HypX/HoxX